MRKNPAKTIIFFALFGDRQMKAFDHLVQGFHLKLWLPVGRRRGCDTLKSVTT
jgi:hypothetical protein